MSKRSNLDEVEQLLLNAQLRDELEPFLDDALKLVNVRRMSTSQENDYLASMLAWERAPVLPISRWFDPELVLPPPDVLGDAELHRILWDTIHRLYEQRIVLEFTDHLSDRQLYCVICRDILPTHEKKIDQPRNFLHWHCFDDTDDPDLWLRFYATPEERRKWSQETGEPLPPAEQLPYRRRMPRRTL